MKFIENFKSRVFAVFALDYRSLALFRIGMGVTIIADLIERLSDLNAHYTDAGVLPREALYKFWSNWWNFSLHSMFGVWQLELILFIIAIVFALMLIVGYRTTLATIASWILLVSIQNRNPAVLQGGDVIFRAMMFFAMFVPWGKYLSIDSLRKNYKIKDKLFLSGGTVGLVLQVFIFYFYAGILKTSKIWTVDGSAVYYTLNIDQLTTGFGHYLLGFPTLITIISFLVLYLEIYGAILLLSPFATSKIRMVILTLLALMQIGINLCLPIGLFGLISIVVTLPLLPSLFFDKILFNLRNKISSKNKTGVLYYDFDCTFCAKASRLIIRLLWIGKNITAKPGIEDNKVADLMQKENSWVFWSEQTGQYYFRTDAFIEMLKISPIFSCLGVFFRNKFVKNESDKLYKIIAEKRLAICLPENNEVKKNRTKKVVTEFVAYSMCIYIFVFNLQWIDSNYKVQSSVFDRVAQFTALNQKFNMFAPMPATDDGWYVIAGKLRGGKDVDIFRGGTPVDFAKPEDVASLYKNQRWQKYMMNLWSSDYESYRLYYGQYLCRQWNSKHDGSEILETFDIIFMLEPTEPDYKTPTITPTTIWKHTCF